MGLIAKKEPQAPDLRTRNLAEPIWLFHDHTFGRDARCSSVMQGNKVSRFHARISWDGRRWVLRDLGSRNGTFVNGRVQTHGESCPLEIGDRILFGDIQEEYVLLEAEEPRSLLLIRNSQDVEVRIPLIHLLPLPSPDRPICTVFQVGDEEFALERETGEMIRLEHGSTIMVDGIPHRVVLQRHPGESPRTGSSDLIRGVDDIRLDIAVAPDEESAAILLHSGAERHAFSPKAHFYLLAYLARNRSTRAPTPSGNGDDDREDRTGWVDCELACKELRISREHLAQQVFRVRQEFKSGFPHLAEQMIDRSLRGKMRIGLPGENIRVTALE